MDPKRQNPPTQCLSVYKYQRGRTSHYLPGEPPSGAGESDGVGDERQFCMSVPQSWIIDYS